MALKSSAKYRIPTPLVLICVNYRTENDTRSFIGNLRKLPLAEHVNIVVANNSAQSSEDPEFNGLINKNTFVVNLPENLGYFGGAQAAWEWYQKNHLTPLSLQSEDFRIQTKESPSTPLVIVSNVDIEFPEGNFFKKLLELELDSNVGVIGASIISDLSLRDCNPFLRQRPSALRMHFYKWIFSNYITCQFYQLLGLGKSLLKARLFRKSATKEVHTSTLRDESNKALLSTSSSIYAAHGCLMIFTPSYFEAGGNFRHGAFLYGEEITVAEFCRSHQLLTIHLNDLKARHREHGSTGLLYSRSTINFISKSSRYIADTYFS